MAGRGIFRQAALDRMSSPEQLDRLVTITDARGWIALAVCGGLMAWLLIWSVFGSIPTNVKGQGILLQRDGVLVNASSQASGILKRFTVKIGDVVKKGEPVAYIEQDMGQQRRTDAAEALQDQQNALSRLDSDYRKELSSKRQAIVDRRRALQPLIDADEKRISFLNGVLGKQEKYAREGIFSESSLDEIRAEIARIRTDEAGHKEELSQLDLQLIQLQNRYRDERSRQILALNDARRNAGQQSLSLKQDNVITAPIDGRVTELKSAPGDLVQAGQPVLSVEGGSKGLQAFLFMPTADGKKLAVGQTARISPANVKKEEYGSLLGRVAGISDFPVTRQGMDALLSNPSLISLFSSQGPPYEVRIDLLPASGSRSGYRWTSKKGAPYPLLSGTTFEAEVTVTEQRPITLLIPFLRKTTGLY